MGALPPGPGETFTRVSLQERYEYFSYLCSMVLTQVVRCGCAQLRSGRFEPGEDLFVNATETPVGHDRHHVAFKQFREDMSDDFVGAR